MKAGDNKIHLVSSYYQCNEPARMAEIDHCLATNIDNHEIHQIHLFIDDGCTPPFESEKLIIQYLPARPTYRDWLQYIKAQKLNGICLLANSDMYFDQTLAQVGEILCLPDRLLALSRWEINGEQCQMHSSPHWSQDVWGVNCGSEFDDSLINSLNFAMGVPRCDNKMAYVFSIHGWKLFNPCRFIKSYHLHETNHRSYDKKYDKTLIGGVAYVHPTAQLTEESRVDIDVWVLRANMTRISAINSTLEKWRKEKYKNPDVYYDLSGHIGTPIGLKEMESAINQGSNIFTHGGIYDIYRHSEELFFRDHLKQQYFKKPVSYVSTDPKQLVSCFFPSVLTDHVGAIRDSATSSEDVNFWQYPCSTEKQAFLNHLAIQGHNTYNDRQLHLYVPLPWATYIDKKQFPQPYLRKVQESVFWYQSLAALYAVELSVHTVCQQIHWPRMLETAKQIGITDIHLSHKDSQSQRRQEELGFQFRLHGWPLIAVNHVAGERSHGLEYKQFKDKNLLASFIGAQMKHYLNHSRINLLEAARSSGRSNVVVDLIDEWNFNKTVYQEQVNHRELNEQEKNLLRERAIKYNSLLSHSKFSLCPIGAGPNTLRLWESIAVGAIPVLFSKDLSILNESIQGIELLENCIVWESEIDQRLFDHLAQQDAEEMEVKRQNLIKLYKYFEKKTCYAID